MRLRPRNCRIVFWGSALGVLLCGELSSQQPPGPIPLPSSLPALANSEDQLVRITLPEAVLPFALTGGVVQLELDRMRGTAFPTAQIYGGKRYDLASIYLDGAGIVLLVNEDETDISPLSDPLLDSFELQHTYISAAELDNLARRYRRVPVAPTSVECGAAGNPSPSTCTQYFLYGIIVDHLWQDAKGLKPSTLGVMWDTTNRSQFAMFFRNNIVQTSGSKYLRSVAHEVGHAFNLHHEDGDGRSSIMNQSGVVGNNFTYEFSTAEQAHLREHLPQRCSRPGTGSFSSVDAAHALHLRAKADCK